MAPQTPHGPATKSLKQLASEKLENGNPSMLGDPISLKAETADSEPTENDRPNKSGGRSEVNKANDTPPKEYSDAKGGKAGQKQKQSEGGKEGGKKEHKTLAQAAKDTNPSMLGDPISLKAEEEGSGKNVTGGDVGKEGGSREGQRGAGKSSKL